MTHKWVDNRGKTATTAMKEKAQGMLKGFIMGSGRWDLESLKLKVTENKGIRFGAAAAGMAD